MSNGTKSRKNKHLSTVVRIIVAGAAVYLICRGQDWPKVGKTLADMNIWYFLGSIVVYLFSQCLVGFRWWLLLLAQHIYIDWLAAIRLNLLGLFYNNFLPSSLGGDFVRAWYITKHTDKKLAAAWSVLIDRIVGVFGMVIIAMFCYIFFMRGKGYFAALTSGQKQSSESSLSLYLWILAGAALSLIIILGIMLLIKPGRKILRKLWTYVEVHGIVTIKKLIDSTIAYGKHPWFVMGALAMTIIVQSLVIISFWILGLTLGIHISPKYYFVFFPIIWIIGSLPISIGGVGIVEGSMVVLFTQFANVAEERILALAICQRLVWIATSIPGIIIHLTGAHLPKDFFVDSEDTLK